MKAARAGLQTFAAWLSGHAWLLLPFLAIPALWPFWRNGLPHSTDGPLHLLRLLLLDRHVREGMLYPRWVPELVLGYGYPLFSYYAPATYYLAEAFHLLGLGYEAALIAAFAVLVLAAGAGMYALARKLFGADKPWAALLAATAYMYGPYLLTNVFIRGAIAEVGAQALLPWILWTTWELMEAERPRLWIGPVALSLGGLAVTHNITLLFVPPLWLAWVLVLWLRGGRRPVAPAQAALAGMAAVAVSAFFWAPLILERQYLSDTAYGISIGSYIPENVWTARNFLDTGLAFDYTFAIPFQLGLVQIALAGLGLVLARRRDAPWLLLLAVALGASLGITEYTLPIWLGSRLLQIAQFPWRLLSILAVPLALFTGGALARVRWGATRSALACALLVAVVIVANRPRLDWMSSFSQDNANLSVQAVPHLERDTNALGTGSALEFLPRWAAGPIRTQSPGTEPGRQQVTVRQANPYALAAAVTSPVAGALRFAAYYFPGWQIVVDGRPARPYPSTGLGLLTVDLPPGAHEVEASWQGTDVQRAAGAVSLAALAGLALAYSYRERRPGKAAPYLALLAFGLLASFSRPTLQPLQAPRSPVAGGGLSLVGYRALVEDERVLTVYPYWYVVQTPTTTLRARFQIQDGTGKTVMQQAYLPYYNAGHSGNWPAGMLMDDAYRLPLPPGLAAGVYRLALGLEAEGRAAQEPAVIGGFELRQPVPPQHAPAHALGVRFGEAVFLAGYDAQPESPAQGRPAVVRPGDKVTYTLFWRAGAPAGENYHGFVHLLDAQQPLVKTDQLAGSLAPSRVWDATVLQPDRYALRIPAGAHSGLYWPSVGLYHFETEERLPVFGAAGEQIGDDYRLPPIKVLGSRPAAPGHAAQARFADLATLLGYDLAAPAAGVRAGEQFTLTLHFRSETATRADYTRFVHLYSPQLGMAAQQDGTPQAGNNPTWAWVPGEVIADRVGLTVSPDARPGRYTLAIGLYATGEGGTRVPAADGQGRPLPEDQVILSELSVIP